MSRKGGLEHIPSELRGLAGSSRMDACITGAMAIAIQNFITVGRGAALLGDINALVNSNMLYKWQLDSSRCPLVNRRRRIPLDYLLRSQNSFDAVSTPYR